MAGETPVRVDQEAHALLKEQAEQSGRTLRDLASEAIRNQVGRDLRDEVKDEVDRLSEICDRLEAQAETLEELTAVPGEVSDLTERLENVEDRLSGEAHDFGQHNQKLDRMVNALEDAFERAIKMLRGEA